MMSNIRNLYTLQDHAGHSSSTSGIEPIFDTVRHVHERPTVVGSAPRTAMRYAAEQRNLAESIVELREMAGGRNDILAEAAGIEAGSWCASPATHVGHELICAGMLILAGGGNSTPLDYRELER